MGTGDFTTLSLDTFIAVVVLVPVISLLLLLKERRAIRRSSPYCQPLTPIFLVEIWFWLIGAFVAGCLLAVLLGFFVYVNAHSKATGVESIPPLPLILVVGIIAGLALFGWLLHVFARKEVRHQP